MFGHVADARLRAILETSSTDMTDLKFALSQTADAVAYDEADENCLADTLDERADALGKAEDAWEASDWQGAIDALRHCWSV